MTSTLIGKQAVVIGAGMAGLHGRRCARRPLRSSRCFGTRYSALGARPSGRDAAGAARPWAFVQRPASARRAVPGIRTGSRAGGSRTAQGWSRCSRRTPGLRSFPATRPRLVRLRGVPAGDRARRATVRGRPRKHHAASALPGQGSVGVARWRDSHRRALRERERCERDDCGGSRCRCLRTRRPYSFAAAVDRPTTARGDHYRHRSRLMPHAYLPSRTTPRPIGKAS